MEVLLGDSGPHLKRISGLHAHLNLNETTRRGFGVSHLPIQTGVSAPTAAGGMDLGPYAGPYLFRT